MPKAQNSEEKYHYMTETPIPKLVCTLAVPTIISMLVTSFYNMADTFFVGKIDNSTTGAVGIVFSLMAIIQAIGFTFGHGSGNFISRSLGHQNYESAERMCAVGFFSALFAGMVLTVVGLIFLEPLVKLLGATPTILPHAKAYARFILIGAPYMTASLVLNNQLRLQGNAFYAMIGIVSGAVINIGLDPLFIFVLGMGVSGAALATIISQFVSFLLLLYGFRKGGIVRLSWSNYKPDKEAFLEILKGGLPSFWRQALASLATICLNWAAGSYGDAAIAAMSVVSRISMFAFSALLGFGQGFQPVCGYNFGAGLYHRVKEAFWFCVKISFVVLLVIAAVGWKAAPDLVALFRKGDIEVLAIGSEALRMQCLTFPLLSWVTVCNMMCQNIGRTKEASVLAMARQGLFFVPAVAVLPLLFGLRGIYLSQPLADVLTFIVAIPIGLKVLRMLADMPSREKT